MFAINAEHKSADVRRNRRSVTTQKGIYHCIRYSKCRRTAELTAFVINQRLVANYVYSCDGTLSFIRFGKLAEPQAQNVITQNDIVQGNTHERNVQLRPMTKGK